MLLVLSAASGTWVSVMAVVALGFFLGMRHATDPDHVLAITTILARERTIARAVTVGVSWGVGHTFTILAVGGAIILFGLVVPARLGMTMEMAVALMLLLLGAANVRSFTRSAESIAVAQAESRRPECGAGEEPPKLVSRLDAALGGARAYSLVRPLIVGVVHGLAGSAAVALLVLATIPQPRWAVAYLVVFGVGTIAGMTMITTAIASALLMGARSARLASYLGLASGVLSVAFGAVMVYQIGIVGGLFQFSAAAVIR